MSVLPGNTYTPTCIGHRNILFLFVLFQRREMTRVEVWMMISGGDKIRKFWKWAICTVETHKQAKVWVLKPPSMQCDWKLLESWQKARKNVWRRRIFAAISKADYLWLCFTPSWWPRRPTWWRRTAKCFASSPTLGFKAQNPDSSCDFCDLGLHCPHHFSRSFS